MYWLDLLWLKDRIDSLILNTQQSTTLYVCFATLSISMIGFLWVATTFVFSLIGKEDSIILNEFKDKGGLSKLLTIYKRMMITFAFVLLFSIIALNFGLANDWRIFVLTSSLMIISIWYLFTAIYITYTLAELALLKK